MTSWDPEDCDSIPRWRAHRVLNVLGMEFERRDIRFARGGSSGALHPLQTLDFACGCVAADDTGWASCGKGLHLPLSESHPKSDFVASFRSMRAVFDAVLAETWKRRGGEADNYYEYYEARMREPLLGFAVWQRSHDLTGESVWKSGYLQAELDHVPMERDIVLAPSVSSHPGFELMYRDARGHIPLPADTREAVRTVYGL
jgi:hypothetical protein